MSITLLTLMLVFIAVAFAFGAAWHNYE